MANSPMDYYNDPTLQKSRKIDKLNLDTDGKTKIRTDSVPDLTSKEADEKVADWLKIRQLALPDFLKET